MFRRVSILMGVAASLLWLHPVVARSQQPMDAPVDFPSQIVPVIGGVPSAAAQAIFEHHRAELLALRGTKDVWLGLEHIHIITSNLDVPTEVEGLPVQVHPPMLAIPRGGRPYREVITVLEQHRAELMALPGVERVGLGFAGLLVTTAHPELLPAQVEDLAVEARAPLRPPTVGGIPSLEALAIVERNREKLLGLPGVEGLGIGVEGALVITDTPSALLAAVEGLPVVARHPLHPASSGGLPYKMAQTILERNEEWLFRLPGVEGVTVGVEGLLIFTDNPAVLPAAVEGLVVIARGLQMLPVAGIPHKEAVVIFERNRPSLLQVSGVTEVRLGADGFHVTTTEPALLPMEVDGLPIRVFSPR